VPGHIDYDDNYDYDNDSDSDSDTDSDAGSAFEADNQVLSV